MEEKILDKKKENSVSADTGKAVRMTIYVMPSTLEKLKADAKKELRAVCNHAGLIIGRYYDGVQNGK